LDARSGLPTSSEPNLDMLGSLGGSRVVEDQSAAVGPADLAKQVGSLSLAQAPEAASRRMRTLPAARVEEDLEERPQVAVWIGIGLAAVLVVGGLGYVGYRARVADTEVDAPVMSSDPVPSAREAASASPRADGAVVLQLKVEPSSATVAIDGDVVNERELRMPKSDVPRTLVVSAPGYKTSRSEFTPSVGGTLVVNLVPDGKKKSRN
jgi:hypothetical protein